MAIEHYGLIGVREQRPALFRTAAAASLATLAGALMLAPMVTAHAQPESAVPAPATSISRKPGDFTWPECQDADFLLGFKGLPQTIITGSSSLSGQK
ncbi:hypothetical protein [Nocardia sp. NPDC005366]|uniref:hypothetical protein n=1 Tax=Nocardia sp. NPDC005366 TaxID=3156878 RepID=UPI0033B664FC